MGDHNSSQLDVQFKHVVGAFHTNSQIYVSKQRYPHGVSVKVVSGSSLCFEYDESKSMLLVSGPESCTVKLVVTKQQSPSSSFVSVLGQPAAQPAQSSQTKQVEAVSRPKQ